MEISTFFECGTRNVCVEITGSNMWQKEDRSREYFDLKFDDKGVYITKFYKLISGPTTDRYININGAIFCYQLGLSGESGTKQDHAKAALEELAVKILKSRNI